MQDVRDWIPEVLSVIVFGGVYTILVYQWFVGELSTAGTAFMWLGFLLSVLVLFGVERVRNALSVADEINN